MKKIFTLIMFLFFLCSCSEINKPIEHNNIINNKNNYNDTEEEQLNNSLALINNTSDKPYYDLVEIEIIDIDNENYIDSESNSVNMIEVRVLKRFNQDRISSTSYDNYIESLDDKQIKIIVSDELINHILIGNKYIYHLEDNVVVSKEDELFHCFDARENDYTFLEVVNDDCLNHVYGNSSYQEIIKKCSTDYFYYDVMYSYLVEYESLIMFPHLGDYNFVILYMRNFGELPKFDFMKLDYFNLLIDLLVEIENGRPKMSGTELTNIMNEWIKGE